MFDVNRRSVFSLMGGAALYLCMLPIMPTQASAGSCAFQQPTSYVPNYQVTGRSNYIVRKQPNQNCATGKYFTAGQKATVHAETGDWRFIENHDNGAWGWVHKGAFKSTSSASVSSGSGTSTCAFEQPTQYISNYTATGRGDYIVRQQPNQRCDSGKRVKNGHSVTVHARTGKWLFIQNHSNRAWGWVHENAFQSTNNGSSASGLPINGGGERPPSNGGNVKFTYVAIGDSYAAGSGLKEESLSSATYDRVTRCMRHWNAYPGRVEKELRRRYGSIETAFVACSGDKIGNAFVQVKNSSSLLQRADLVTVTIGGNDLDWPSVLKQCAIPFSEPCTNRRRDLQARVSKMLTNLGVFYDYLIAATPANTKIVVVGYPHLAPNPPKRNCIPFVGSLIDSRERQMMRDLGTQINNGIASLVRSRQAQMRMINILPIFDKHEPCTTNEWVNSVLGRYSSPQSFHPKNSGHVVIYNQIKRHIP